MQGAVLYAPRDVRFEERDDPKIIKPTDAVIRIAAACVCGSDLWPYRAHIHSCRNRLGEPSPRVQPFRCTDHVLVSLNLLELMSVAFLPVPTGILGTWASSDRNRLSAIVFYGGTLAILGVFHNLLWWYGAYRHTLTSPELPARKRRALTLTWMAGPVLYSVSTGLAWLDPRISLAGFVILGILYLLPTPRVLMLAQRTRKSRRDALR